MDGDPDGLKMRRARLTDPDAVRLIAEVQAEYAALYGGAGDETPLDPDMFDAPSGAFFVGYLGGSPVAMGGWRSRPDVHAFGRGRAAEIKRMYVGLAARRRGLARQVLAHLENSAACAGADLMVLETGIEQPQAIALYTSAGYQPVAGFGHYKWSPKARYYGRPL